MGHIGPAVAAHTVAAVDEWVVVGTVDEWVADIVRVVAAVDALPLG